MSTEQPQQEYADSRAGRYAPEEQRSSPHDTDRPRHDETQRADSDCEARASELSPAKLRRQSRLPALDDDADVGVQKEYVVTRDGKADLRFNGVLLASAAPSSAPKGQWEEYRVYQTNAGKHVFSKVRRTVLETEAETFEAEVYDPSPTSVPSQLLRGAKELTRSRPLTWIDGAVSFFGYDPLAKALYRKLSVQFEEQIS